MSLFLRIVAGAVVLWPIAYLWPFGADDSEQVVAIEPPGPATKPLYPRSALPGEKPAHAIYVAPQKPRPQDQAVAEHTPASKPKPTPPQPERKVENHTAAAKPKAPSESDDKVNAERTAALEKKDAVATKQPKPKLFYRVIVRDGDTIEAGGTVITLSGIKAHDTDEKCKDGTGHTWPCGTRARTALTRLIHGRAVSCVTSSSRKQKSFTARCTVGRTDLSVWMVTQGWAEPAAPKDSKLADAAEAAQKKKLGIWR
jgi:endonuclease YncB( thermonuclease family)